MKAAASSWRDVLQLLTSFQQRQLEANESWLPPAIQHGQDVPPLPDYH